MMARKETQKEQDNAGKTNLQLVMETMPSDWKVVLLCRFFYAGLIFVGTLWMLRKLHS